jgi:hypothetical protein
LEKLASKSSKKRATANQYQKIEAPKVNARRLEELRLEVLGLTQAEIVKQVCEKFGCGPRIIYNDFETREEWQSILTGSINPERLFLKILNRQEHIYRRANVVEHTSNNPLVKLGALNTMSKANLAMFEIGVLPSLMCRLRVLEKKMDRGVVVL